MTQGVSLSDILVSVGAGDCNITSLATNRLICIPPLEHPGHGDLEGPDDAVVVRVCSLIIVQSIKTWNANFKLYLIMVFGEIII